MNSNWKHKHTWNADRQIKNKSKCFSENFDVFSLQFLHYLHLFSINILDMNLLSRLLRPCRLGYDTNCPSDIHTNCRDVLAVVVHLCVVASTEQGGHFDHAQAITYAFSNICRVFLVLFYRFHELIFHFWFSNSWLSNSCWRLIFRIFCFEAQ